MTKTDARIHYGWVVVGLAFLTSLIGAGIRSAPSVFIHPLEGEFGWSRAAIASAIGLNLLIYGIASPIAGRMIDQFGARKVMLGSLGLAVVGVSGTLVMSEFWHLVLFWGVVVGLSAGGGASVLSASVANRWFVARRGLALGLLNSAISTGQLIFLPLLMFVIVASGWRTGSLVLVAAAVMVLIMVALWMRNDPGELGLSPYGAQSVMPSIVPSTSGLASIGDQPPVTFVGLMKNKTFWFLAASHFVCGATSSGLIATHLIPHSIDHQIPAVTAAAAVGMMGFMNFIGTILSGMLTDKMNPRHILSLVYLLRGASLFLLPFVYNFPGLLIFGIIYGLDWFATVPPIIALAGDTFGRRSVATVFGWIFLFHQLGGSALATFGGVLRVWFGDYHLAFAFGGVLALAAAGLALWIPIRTTTLLPNPQQASS